MLTSRTVSTWCRSLKIQPGFFLFFLAPELCLALTPSHGISPLRSLAPVVSFSHQQSQSHVVVAATSISAPLQPRCSPFALNIEHRTSHRIGVTCHGKKNGGDGQKKPKKAKLEAQAAKTVCGLSFTLCLTAVAAPRLSYSDADHGSLSVLTTIPLRGEQEVNPEGEALRITNKNYGMSMKTQLKVMPTPICERYQGSCMDCGMQCYLRCLKLTLSVVLPSWSKRSRRWRKSPLARSFAPSSGKTKKPSRSVFSWPLQTFAACDVCGGLCAVFPNGSFVVSGQWSVQFCFVFRLACLPASPSRLCSPRHAPPPSISFVGPSHPKLHPEPSKTALAGAQREEDAGDNEEHLERELPPASLLRRRIQHHRPLDQAEEEARQRQHGRRSRHAARRGCSVCALPRLPGSDNLHTAPGQ